MAMGTTLQVIAEPRRQAILDLLRDGELPVGELVDRLGMSQPLVSKHLRVLKDAGLVQVRADAQRRLYRIRPEPLAELDEWLAPYRALWTASLDRPPAQPGSKREPRKEPALTTPRAPSPPCGLSGTCPTRRRSSGRRSPTARSSRSGFPAT